MTRWAVLPLAGLLAGCVWLVWPSLSSLWSEAAVALFQAQQELNGKLAAGLRALDAGGFGAILALAGLSFLYGVLHALGPGHGKAVVSAYVLADAQRLRQGLALAWCASALQAFAAILVVGLFVLVLGAAAKQTQLATLSLERMGYALIAALGLVMVTVAAHRSWSGRTHEPRHHHHHDQGCAHALPRWGRWREVLAVLSVGIRPCSGAVLVLAFAKAAGAFAAGILATLAMAVGTAVTVSSLALATFYSRRAALKLAGRGERAAFVAGNVLAVLAGTALVLIGALLLAGSFARPVSPFRI